jgi:hypothetical protein
MLSVGDGEYPVYVMAQEIQVEMKWGENSQYDKRCKICSYYAQWTLSSQNVIESQEYHWNIYKFYLEKSSEGSIKLRKFP